MYLFAIEYKLLYWRISSFSHGLKAFEKSFCFLISYWENGWVVVYNWFKQLLRVDIWLSFHLFINKGLQPLVEIFVKYQAASILSFEQIFEWILWQKDFPLLIKHSSLRLDKALAFILLTPENDRACCVVYACHFESLLDFLLHSLVPAVQTFISNINRHFSLFFSSALILFHQVIVRKIEVVQAEEINTMFVVLILEVQWLLDEL